MLIQLLPVVFAAISIGRWSAGKLSLGSLTATLIASLVAMSVAASGISRANRR